MPNQRHKDKEAGQVTSWLYICDKKKLRNMAKENGLTMSDFIKKILDNFWTLPKEKQLKILN